MNPTSTAMSTPLQVHIRELADQVTQQETWQYIVCALCGISAHLDALH